MPLSLAARAQKFSARTHIDVLQRRLNVPATMAEADAGTLASPKITIRDSWHGEDAGRAEIRHSVDADGVLTTPVTTPLKSARAANSHTSPATTTTTSPGTLQGDAQIARALQMQEDELAARSLSQEDTHGQGSADAVIADEIQHQEGLIASVPLRDEWGGDKDVYRFSEMEAETPIRPSMPSPLGVGGTPMGRPSYIDQRKYSNKTQGSKAMSCAKQGVELMQQNKLEDACRCFERGVQAGDGNDSLIMKMHAQLSMICRMLGKHADSKTHAENQLEYAQKLHSVASECTALRALGVACMGGGLEAGKAEDTDEPEKAGELLAQALQCFEDLATKAEDNNEHLVAAAAWRDMMKVHRTLRNDLQALQAAENHLAMLRARGDKCAPVEIGRAVSSVATLRAANGLAGEIDWNKEDFMGVIELFWEQAAIGEAAGEHILIAQAYYEISKLMETAGSWADWFGPAKARQWLQKAITSYKTVSGTHKLSKKQRADFVDATARLAVLDDPDYMPPGCSVM